MQNAELEFEISLKALSVLRYITDHVERWGSGANGEGRFMWHFLIGTARAPVDARS